MSTISTENLFQAAMALPPQERAALAEQLLSSLDEEEAKVDEAWAIEAERRLQAFRQNRIQGIPAETVFGVLLPKKKT